MVPSREKVYMDKKKWQELRGKDNGIIVRISFKDSQLSWCLSRA